jgi:hypothetical protein
MAHHGKTLISERIDKPETGYANLRIVPNNDDLIAVFEDGREVIYGGSVGGGTVVKPKAATPTGEYDATKRTLTIKIGNYPLSRLVVSENFSAFKTATTLTVNLASTYIAPDYYRYKVIASDAELESDVYKSQGFPAQQQLIDLPVVLIGLIQSNGVGFGYNSDVAPNDRGPYNNVLINDYFGNTIVPYQLGVNDQGVKKSFLVSNGNTSDVYQDGHGADYQIAKRAQADNRKIGIIKKTFGRSNADGASLDKWSPDIADLLYAQLKEETIQAKNNFIAAGYNPIIIAVIDDVKEAEVSNPSEFPARTHAVLDRMEADGLFGPETMRIIQMGYAPNNYDIIRAMQQQLYLLDTVKYKKADVGHQSTIEGTHLTSDGQKALGNKDYNIMFNTTTPPEGDSGSGNVGTYAIESGYSNFGNVLVSAQDNGTLVGTGFRMAAKIIPRYLGEGFNIQGVMSKGIVGGDGSKETLSMEILPNGELRVRLKLQGDGNYKFFKLANSDGTSILLQAANSYKIIADASQVDANNVLISIYLNGVAYDFPFTGKLQDSPDVVSFASWVTGPGNTDNALQTLLGQVQQMSYDNKSYTQAQNIAFNNAGLEMIPAKYGDGITKIYAPGFLVTPTSGTTINQANSANPLQVLRY